MKLNDAIKATRPRTSDARTEPEAMSIREAARISGIGMTAMYAALARGDLKARKLGRRTIVLREDLRIFLDNLPPFRSEASGAKAA
jgi:hypothetical protein